MERISQIQRKINREAKFAAFTASKASQIKISNRHVGRAAELLVCFEFARRGYDAVINDFPGAPTDLFVDLGKDVLRVQVKGTQLPTLRTKTDRTMTDGWKRPVYSFSTDESRVDLFAFVALDIRVILFLPVNSCTAKNKHFNASTFVSRAEGSLDRFLNERLFN